MTNPMYYLITIMAALGTAMILKNDIHIHLYSEYVARIYKILLVWVIFFCLQDTAWGIISSINEGGRYNVLFYGSTLIFHISAAVSVFLWMEFVVGYSKDWLRHGFVYRCAGVGFLVFEVILLLSNGLYKYIFYIDVLGNYQRGFLGIVNFGLQYLFYLFIAGLSICGILRSGEKKKAQYGAILMFVLSPLVAGILEIWFIHMPFHTLGFFVGICVIHSYLIKREREALEEFEHSSYENALNNITRQFDLIFEVDLDSFHEKIHRVQGAFAADFFEAVGEVTYEMRIKGYSNTYVVPACQQEFESMMEKENVWDHVKEDKPFVVRHIDNIGNDKNVWYETRIMKKANTTGNREVIVCFRNINDEVIAEQAKSKQEKRREDSYIRQMSTDPLTGLMNRMAFEEHMEKLEKQHSKSNYVIVSFDVNGLKEVNDTMGHSAGDELLRGAANCIRQCFGIYGQLYRIGGDEFVAILKIEMKHMEALRKDFLKTCLDWEGVRVKELSVAIGYAGLEENNTTSVRELLNHADQYMYEAKARHYAEYGIDRKGQQIAFNILCKKFQKILKVNLTEDSYEIIQIDRKEKLERMDYSNILSVWVSKIVEAGIIYEEDKEYFLERMNLDYLRTWFKQGNPEKVFTYRRKQGEEYCKAVVEMHRTPDYTDDCQMIFLYVRYVIF